MVSTGIFNAVVQGFVMGSVVALGAIGLALVYGIADVPNFAHGDLISFGAFLALFVNKPNTVPVFELLSSENQAVSFGGMVVLFLIVVGSVHSVSYFLSEEDSLLNSWLSTDLFPSFVGPYTILISVVIGILLWITLPSIWSGIILAMVLLAALSPIQEKVIFEKFRKKGSDLVVMLMVSLGLSFVLRFGIQTLYGPNNREFTVANTAEFFGNEIPLFAVQYFDVYILENGVNFELINTSGPDPSIIFSSNYPWNLFVVLLLGTLFVTSGTHYLTKERFSEYISGAKVKVVLSLIGVGAFILLAALFGQNDPLSGSIEYSTRISIAALDLLTVVITITMTLLLYLILKRTKLGTAMRASGENIDLAKTVGINTDRVFMSVWIIAGIYAAVGGVMLGVLFGQVTATMGFNLLIPMFAAVILGGVGSIFGALIGSYMVGISMEVGIYLLPIQATQRVSFAFLVLLGILLIKPEGIMGGT